MAGPVLNIESRAKINLFLQVRGKRPDGFHELLSLFQEITLSDTLEFYARKDETLEVLCPDIPERDNLITRAAECLLPRARNPVGFTIRVRKRIPAGAGLGGGSSNAAATLKILNDVWKCGIDFGELQGMGATIGSDVPFFLRGGTALIRGRGERIESLDLAAINGPFLLIVPPVRATTSDVYRELAFPPGAMNEEDPAFLRFLHDKGPLPLRNDLFGPAKKLFPSLSELDQQLRKTHPDRHLMTGSGSAFWAQYPPDRISEAAVELTNVGQITIVEAVRQSGSHP